MEMYPKSISSEILKEDIKVINKPFMYIKRYKDKIFRVYNSELRRIILKVIDINGEQKTVGVFHQPDWILATAKWTNKSIRRLVNIIQNCIIIMNISMYIEMLMKKSGILLLIICR